MRPLGLVGVALILLGGVLYIALLYHGSARWVGSFIALIGLALWAISRERPANR